MYMAQHTVDVEKQLRRRKKGFPCCSFTLGPFPAFHVRLVGASGGWGGILRAVQDAMGLANPQRDCE